METGKVDGAATDEADASPGPTTNPGARPPSRPNAKRAAAATARSNRRPAGPTRAERLRADLAEDILLGRLEPGTPLDETTLANRHGVSRTPVREALRELAAAGLIEHRPHRGAVVATTTRLRLDEMFTVMAELEALCAGYAAIAMTPAERITLETMQADAAEMVRRGDLAAYTEANDAFHAFVYQASHNGFLAESVLAVRQRVSPFRRVQFHSLGRLAISHHEHGLVVEAMLRGDRDAAAREMRAHLESSRASLDLVSPDYMHEDS